jgi:hypothetical protein
MHSATWTAASHESLIGPPSELIHIIDFLRGSRDSVALTSAHLWHVSEDVDSAEQDPIMSECRWVPRTNDGITLLCRQSVDDICSKISDIFNNPRLYVHARHIHDASVNAVYDLAERNAPGKRKRKREIISEMEETPDLIALKNDLADIKLKSWPYARFLIYLRNAQT